MAATWAPATMCNHRTRGVPSHRQPVDPASRRTSFGLLVIAPPPHDPNVPHHDLDEEAEMYHLTVEYWPTTTAAH